MKKRKKQTYDVFSLNSLGCLVRRIIMDGTKFWDCLGLIRIGLSWIKSSNQLASSPPFFCGSPPSRASYPVIQDEQFGNSSKMAPFFPAPPSSLSERN
ncbi:hypothetical protein PRUPE_1G559100 [Prunus persica]|uniref:Uncharacterized protein n=1 Tax=Prunus persica TaxID=3760 RepID=M5XMT1_PRUPE|nr:hypothetical protein PRUPE_1G559100 [Prunus persica]